jgi:long-subunit fatty acid transport protein
VLLALATAPQSRAQGLEDVLRYSQRLPGTGARTTGMAGAGGAAGVAGIGAFVDNPAGLGWMSQSQFDGSFAYGQVDDAALYALPGASPTRNTQSTTDYAFDNAGLAYKVPTDRGSLVLGIAFNRTAVLDRGLDYRGRNNSNSITDTFLPDSTGFGVDGEDILFDRDRPRLAFDAGAIDFSTPVFENNRYPFFQAVTPGLPIRQQEDLVESGHLSELNLGGAVEVAPGVMVGGGLNIAFGSYTFERFYQEIDLELGADDYFIAGTDLTGFDELRVEEEIDADLTGVNFRGGVSADLAPGLRLGLALETPTWYSVDETFGTRMQTFFDSGGSLEAGSTTDQRFEYSVRTPWRFSGGVRYRLGRLLTVSGGAEFVDWSQARLRAGDVSFADVNRTIRDLDPTLNLNGGAELHLGALTLRGGLAVQPDPQTRTFLDVDDQDTDRERRFYAAGFTYRFDTQFALEASWTLERFDDTYQPYPDDFVPGDNVSITAPTVREQIDRHRVLLGVSYRF